MSQRLGGGTYEPPRPSEEQAAADGFRPTVLMEKVSRYIEAFPGRNQRAIREAGLGKRTETVIQALRILVDEGFVEEAREGTSNIYRSLDPYRRAEDQTGHEVADWGEE
jgi:DNA-binding transcriptional ArsR family regulator